MPLVPHCSSYDALASREWTKAGLEAALVPSQSNSVSGLFKKQGLRADAA